MWGAAVGEDTQKEARWLSQLLARQGNMDYCRGKYNKLMFLRAAEFCEWCWLQSSAQPRTDPCSEHP